MELLFSGNARSSSPGAARLDLRDATAQDHAVVDRAYSKFDLADPADYRAFLQAQFACVAPLERALTAAGAETVLPDWATRLRAALLMADLAALDAPPANERSPLVRPGFRTPAAILGAIYVLEGSRFGGSVLARRVAQGAPVRFLGAGAEPRAWRVLMSALDRHLGRERALAAAIASARAVFAGFEAAARQQLEPALG